MTNWPWYSSWHARQCCLCLHRYPDNHSNRSYSITCCSVKWNAEPTATQSALFSTNLTQHKLWITTATMQSTFLDLKSMLNSTRLNSGVTEALQYTRWWKTAAVLPSQRCQYRQGERITNWENFTVCVATVEPYVSVGSLSVHDSQENWNILIWAFNRLAL